MKTEEKREFVVKKIPFNTFKISLILSLSFFILKLLKYISWSWWVVLLPIWLPPAFMLMLFLCSLLGIALISFLVWLFQIK